MKITRFALAAVLWIGLLEATRADWYVATNGTGDGTSWLNATNDIQGAITKSSAGETVWVSNGVYETGGVTNCPAGTILTNRVAIDKVITLRSLNGSSVTTIKGARNPVTTNGLAAVRCVYMTNGSSLIGFTLTNGATLQVHLPIPVTNDNHRGGGVYCPNATPMISNCVIAGNTAVREGGGTYYGLLYNCTLSGNTAGDTNLPQSFGGGAAYGNLFNCTVSGNRAFAGEGFAGGTYNANLSNCLVIGNTAVDCGGARNGKLYNCTIVGNSGRSGVRVNSLLRNCIIYFNSPRNYEETITAAMFTNCCTIPMTNGWATGNITNDPMFITNGSGYGTSLVAGNYRLKKESPCVNAGTNEPWMVGAFDMDGHSRIDRVSGLVDMGCYEFLNSGTMFGVH